MTQQYYVEIVFNKEKLSNGSPVFVAHCPTLGIASQGDTIEEAKKNIQEAIELYLEEMPEKYDELQTEEIPIFSVIEIKKDAKTSEIIR
jgi:predicted RNase H-like HicB family nuclease